MEFIIHTNCTETGVDNIAPYDTTMKLIENDQLDQCYLKNAKEEFKTENQKEVFTNINNVLNNAIKSENVKEGGYTQVYLYQNYALRILKDERKDNEDTKIAEYNSGYIQTYISEKCPTIPKIYAIGMYNGNRPFQLMQNVGSDLFEKAQAQKEKIDREKFHNCVQSIKCMHTYDIVHRDIKPENITINDEGNMFVIDFGQANHSETISSKLCGTLAYLPIPLFDIYMDQSVAGAKKLQAEKTLSGSISKTLSGSISKFFKSKKSPVSSPELSFLKQCDVYMLALAMLIIEDYNIFDNIAKKFEETYNLIQNIRMIPKLAKLESEIPELKKSLIKDVHTELDTLSRDKKKYKKYISFTLDPNVHTIESFEKDFFSSQIQSDGGKRKTRRGKQKIKRARKSRRKKHTKSKK